MRRVITLVLLFIGSMPAWADAPTTSETAPRRRPARPAGPTLAELVAIDASTPPVAPSESPPSADDAGASPPAPSRVAAPPVGTAATSSTSSLPVPWAALGLLGVLAGGAGARWWSRRQQASARGNLLQVREALSLAPRRQLLLVEVGQRSVLLSSTEAGITMLMECPRDTLRPTAFGDELHRLLDDESTRREPVMPLSTMTSSTTALRGDAEASEIMRRLGKSA
jgi:flagellar biogenesis protein FliO